MNKTGEIILFHFILFKVGCTGADPVDEVVGRDNLLEFKNDFSTPSSGMTRLFG